MNPIEVLMIAVSLAMDATAVCLGVGTCCYGATWRARFRLAFHFGLFQFLMPVLGWLLGTSVQLAGTGVADLINGLDHWIAFGLLAFVGGRMIRSGFAAETETYTQDPSRGLSLIMLSIATSLDALAVGLSLALLKVSVWFPALAIGVITAAMSLGGLLLGNRLGEKFGKRMEIVGGAILILIGLRIVLEHLFGAG